jgi:hypothetical protein
MRTAYALPIPFFYSSLLNQIRWGAMCLCIGIDRFPETSVRDFHSTLCNTPEERKSRRNKNLSLSSMRRRYIWGLRTKFHTFFTSAIQEVIDLASVTPSGNRTAVVYPVSIHFTDWAISAHRQTNAEGVVLNSIHMLMYNVLYSNNITVLSAETLHS